MSVSKGIFVFKPKSSEGSSKRSPAKKAKRSPVKERLKVETVQQTKNMTAYKKTWSEVLKIVHSVNNQVNGQLFEKLQSFCKSHLQTNDYIPAASVITGVNIPDHHSFFKSLGDHLKNYVSSFVAILHSKDCANIKQTIQAFVKQLIGSKSDQHLSWDDCNMSYLNLWYQATLNNKDGSSSRNGFNTPIIIIFEDLESFPPSVIEDFILICNNYNHQMPIQMIFGISTATAAIQAILPHKALAHLMLQSFRSEPATILLNQIIECVLINHEFPFKLGSRAFRLLLDIFLYHNFSTSNFVSTLKYCMIEHYYNNPLSYVCCDRKSFKKIIQNLQPQEIEQFRRVHSFMKYVEKQENSEQKRLLLDDEHFKKILKRLLKDLRRHYRKMVVLLSALISLTQDLPGYPLGKQIRESYSLCLDGKITENEGFKRAFKIISLSSKTELLNRISFFQATLQEKSSDFQDEALNEINASITQKLVVFSQRKERSATSPRKMSKVDCKIELSRASNAYQLQEQLKELSMSKKPMNEFEVFRSDILTMLETFFCEHLTSPMDLPFHELFYFDDASLVKKHLIASPRACLQRALNNPGHYLKCECCQLKNNEDILITMPDLCITFKLLQECGRLVNLYDWLQAFSTVASGEECTDKPEDILQARFIHAVSELQFLGYIKPTKRKTDHMARLTWG